MDVARYARILGCFARNGLVREMSFRTNFVLTVLGEIFWLALMVIFVGVIFSHTRGVSDWNSHQYLFLLGVHFLITGIFHALFYTNLQRLSELIRTGHLDFVLLKPANTQFLVSLERIDYASLANAALGLFLCGYGAYQLGVSPGIGVCVLFLTLIVSGVITLYAMMFMFTSTSVWLIRQTSVQQLWFYVSSCAKYPAEIYRPLAHGVLWFVMTFIVPVLIVANLPANVVVRTFEPWMVVYALAISLVMLAFSSWMFGWALRWYRSASS